MINPFDHNYFIGYLNHVNPQYVKVHFPSSVLLNRFIFSGEEFNGGLIGNFVAIEGENHGFIGKILELDLPEKERLELNEKAFQSSDFHPTAKVEILLSFNYFDYKKVSKGLDCYPNIGAKVFVCPNNFIKEYLKNFGVKDIKKIVPYIHIGNLTSNKRTPVIISQQSLFSRHCAIVGTTGGGKSWTVAKLIEQMKINKSKTIIIDPTGEYENLIDTQSQSVVISQDAFFHYRKLTIEDLFFLLKPAGKVQMPKLLEAIRSLKMAEIDTEKKLASYINNGILIKNNNYKRNIGEFYYRNISKIENNLLTFNINMLPQQIAQECIFDTDTNNGQLYGRRNEVDISHCVSLMSRANNLLNTGIFKDIFGFDKKANDQGELTNIIDNFITNPQQYFLRISFEKVGFEFQAREILANAIGKYLLEKARINLFKNNPLVFFVDEAHQFLNRTIVDEYFQGNSLTSFDQIAKECRKYGLFLCIATQMPRDIPFGTLSQMGAFVVHRLINNYDKESISHACSSANSGIISFLPVLGEGEAIFMGVDFPMPITVKIDEPVLKPDSATPQFIVFQT